MLAGSAAAFPDGAPWEAARQEGCAQCHFDAAARLESSAVEIDGLPERVSPGARYRLSIRLVDEQMVKAGFLLSAWFDGNETGAGAFAAADARTDTHGAQARSTEAGAALTRQGVAEWTLDWIAPQATDLPVRIELWANAANDDQSPFGDVTHRRSWQLPAAAPGSDP